MFNGNMSRKIEMCGFVPVTTVLLYAHLRGLNNTEILKYANSGDVTGDKSRVVGYSSTIIYKEEAGFQPLTQVQKDRLLALARRTVDNLVKNGKAAEVEEKDPRLSQAQGAFVTLTKNGQLRGCIGAIIGQKPLVQTIRDMAIAAASQDPRFPPVTADELKDIKVEVSVLSVPRRIKDASVIELGKHGVIVSDGGDHQGVFLPQVATETGWNKEQFLSELCSQKAGLAADCWKNPNNSLFSFTADVFGEK